MNAKETSKYNKEYYRKHSDEIKEASRLYRLSHPEKTKERVKKWLSINHEKKLIYSRKWKKENYNKVKETNRKWREANPDKVTAMRKRAADKYNNTPRGKLNRSIRVLVYRSLKGKKASRPWEKLVGYSVIELRAHLEKQFTPPMTWENYGSYWHVDHKIPIAAFNFKQPEDPDFCKCWELNNLQPLEAIANFKKGSRF